MKRITILLCAFLLMFSCASCRKQSKKSGTENEMEKISSERSKDFYSFDRCFVTESFALYHDNQGRLQIFDVDSKTDIVYCFDAGCEHQQTKRDSITNEILQKGCISYEISSDCVMLREDGMFFLQDNGQVIRADRQGENRRVIATIPFYKLGFRDVIFSSDMMFISYYTDDKFEEIKDENGQTRWIASGELSDTRECGIYGISLTDGTVKELFRAEAYNAMISDTYIRDGHLYFVLFYLDIPPIGPNMETYGRNVDIPEGLTVENYWEEMPKHYWMDIYDYNLTTGELRPILEKCRNGTMTFCRDCFAIAEPDGTTGLYRYSGERFRELPFRIGKGIRSDSGLVCCDENAMDEYLLIDESTGEIKKRVKISSGKFMARVIIGNSCYGSVNGTKGWGLGFISSEDFWNGKIENAIPFNVQ